MSKDTIYFIEGSTPDKQEAAEIKKLKVKRIRNASLVRDGACLEACEAVAGTVPEQYKGVKGIDVLKATTEKTGGKKATPKDDSLS